MGETNLADQIVPLGVVVIVLAPLCEVHVLVRGRWAVAGKWTCHTAQAQVTSYKVQA